MWLFPSGFLNELVLVVGPQVRGDDFVETVLSEAPLQFFNSHELRLKAERQKFGCGLADAFDDGLLVGDHPEADVLDGEAPEAQAAQGPLQGLLPGLFQPRQEEYDEGEKRVNRFVGELVGVTEILQGRSEAEDEICFFF